MIQHLSFAYSLFFLLSASFAVAETPQQETPQKNDDYQLVWADEFNNEGPPEAKSWTYERGFVRNKELQWYQAQNAVCKNGLLTIEARQEAIRNPNYVPDARSWRRNREFSEYSSACILTRGKHAWKYGRFEIRARIDARPGVWPAIWTLGSARGWPGCGEIDVMEYYDESILANACWLGKSGRSAWDTGKHPIENFGPDWSKEFHIWKLEWDASTIKIFVDDRLLNETNLADTVNQDRQRSQPFREPHYLLLNLAVGGMNGGDPSHTEFPSRFEVDYVRVYQKK